MIIQDDFKNYKANIFSNVLFDNCPLECILRYLQYNGTYLASYRAKKLSAPSHLESALDTSKPGLLIASFSNIVNPFKMKNKR